jgi:hypothetical protein
MGSKLYSWNERLKWIFKGDFTGKRLRILQGFKHV